MDAITKTIRAKQLRSQVNKLRVDLREFRAFGATIEINETRAEIRRLETEIAELEVA
jgi:hypothetical protein